MKKILAIKNRRLGDTALWTASLEALREFIGGPVDIAYPAAYAPLFELDPRFNQHYLLEPSLSSRWDNLRKIRQVNYDAVLNFHANNETAILTFLSKGKTRFIHHHHRTPRFTKYSSTIPHVGVPMSAIERDLNVVRGLGWSGASPNPKLFVGSATKQKGEKLLGLSTQSGLKNVALSISASRQSKQWALEKFISLAKILKDRYQLFVLYDFPPVSALWGNLKKLTHTIHTPDLTSLLGCLTHMDGFIGADSGVKHLAAALEIPTVTLFGPESIGEWHGYPTEKHRAIQIPVLCRDQNTETPNYAWCGYGICPLASHACMSQISPEMIVQEIGSIL